MATVRLDKKVIPSKYCCISDPENSSKGLVGFFYNVSSAPLIIHDAKTLVVPQFSFEGFKPPDGWIYAGKGQVDKSSGRKAFIVGRDTPQHHCALKTNYLGNTDLIIRLAKEQTVYDINYISVFCYEYGVDFGHIYFDLFPEQIIVPPYIPPIQSKLPPFMSSISC